MYQEFCKGHIPKYRPSWDSHVQLFKYMLLQSLSPVWLFCDPMDAVCHAPLSVGFPRQELWSGLQFPSPGDRPDPGTEPPSPALAGGFFTAEPPGKPFTMYESESEVTQSCPTLWDPMGCSLPGSSVHGIFQARVLEWVAISFSKGSSQPRDRTQVSRTAGRHFYWLSYRENPSVCV